MSGEIVPQGAKNEALEVICATLLTPEKVTIHNVPDILDVNNLIQLLRDMRVKVEHPSADTYTFQADDVDMEYLSTEEFLRKSGSLRGSVMIVGPLVARFGRALIPKPGGDKIGRRRLDTHFVGIQKLGACFSYDAGRQVYEIEARQLKGAYMLLDEASVTGTANILMAAVLAEGVTTIYNAACEPYLQQLSTMLNRMGARISGVGSNLLTIEGVRSLSGTEHTILPDMIEVGSLLIHQKMFESRLFFVDKLIDMGAQIILCDPHRATVIGLGNRFKLRGSTMVSPDIRAGIALLIAAMSAEGTSTIHNIDQIDRGYQGIDKRLNQIGARITRI